MLLLLMVFAISALPVLTVPGWFTAIGRPDRREPCLPALQGYLAHCGRGQAHVHWARDWAEASSVAGSIRDAP